MPAARRVECESVLHNIYLVHGLMLTCSSLTKSMLIDCLPIASFQEINLFFYRSWLLFGELDTLRYRKQHNLMETFVKLSTLYMSLQTPHFRIGVVLSGRFGVMFDTIEILKGIVFALCSRVSQWHLNTWGLLNMEILILSCAWMKLFPFRILIT